jgi:nucleotide-binding universal stress UspA family protein
MQIDNILIPTDFSECADHALTQAIDLAERFDAKLHILHVINELDPEWYDISDAQQRAAHLRKQIREEARRRLDKIAPDEPHVDFDTEVSLQLSFDVASTINEYVDERNVDLIVMGTHGRRGLERLMLGNVADKLVRHAPCPVMTVNEKAPWVSETKGTAFEEVLAPIDFSDHSKNALQVAKVFAAAHDARLHLLFVAEKRVVPTFSDTGIPGVNVVEMDPEIVRNAEKALRQLNENSGGPDVPARYAVREGEVAHDVVDYAEENGVGLIVMATRGLSGVDRFLLGSNTERIIRVAPCPVLTLQAETDEQ